MQRAGFDSVLAFVSAGLKTENAQMGADSDESLSVSKAKVRLREGER